MPFQNVIEDHFSSADEAAFKKQMDALEKLLQPRCRNLSEEENNKYGSINEQNKLFVAKDLDYRKTQPALSSPDVDWAEFEKDFFDRKFLETGAMRLIALAKVMLETKRLHDYDNFQNALTDYAYTQYKSGLEPGKGYDAKAEVLKQFFPATGGGKGGDAGTSQ